MKTTRKRVVFKIFPREKYMKEHLSEEDWKVFEQFADAEQEASCLSDCDNFIDGFRMGVMIMLDVLLEPSVRK